MLALLVYDWFLCLDQEITFIWNWNSKITSTSLVCRAVIWTQLVATILGTMACSAFSGIRAYALSNRNVWLTAIIILLALPPTAMRIRLELSFPYPLYQIAAELLVIIITWWYTYQSYRIRKGGLKLGESISSLLIYNGESFLGTLYMLDIIFSAASVPDAVVEADGYLSEFFDPVSSILVCRFMLALRRFDSSTGSTTHLGPSSESRIRDHGTASTVLQFAAQPSDSLPAFIVSFAQPVHVDSSLLGAGPDDEYEWREMDVGRKAGG
ncbi:hypothetical protein V8D89_009552 [Ganoderma adspersum]